MAALKNKGMSGVRRLGLSACMLAGIVVGQGCTLGPDFERPAKPTIDGYTPESLVPQTASAPVEAGAFQTFYPSADIPGQWWELYRSPELNSLIEQALKANPDLDSAQASLRQARENLHVKTGALFPTISANGQANNQLTNGATTGLSGFTQQFSVTSASLNISYTPDIWGGARRAAESQAAQVEYQRFQLEATYLTLTSNVVVAAVNLASLREQIAAQEQIIKILSDSLRVVTTQFDLGGASRSDVLIQETTLTQAKADLPPLQKQLAQQRNQLMALLGLPPTDDAAQTLRLANLHLPEDLPLTLPSKLVEQRPDVRSAEAQLHSASAQIGVAASDQMPQFTISGALGYTASGFQTLFLPVSRIWNLGLSLAQTVFDGGQLEHKRRAAIAGFEQATAQYRSTVLKAFQDVANALRALQSDADALSAAAANEQVALASFKLSEEQYRLGAVSYLTLLVSQRTYQTALLGRVRAQATRYSDTAALFQALGGGWWNRKDVDSRADTKADVFTFPPVEDIKPPRPGH